MVTSVFHDLRCRAGPPGQVDAASSRGGMTGMTARVLIVDDHPVFRAGVTASLRDSSRFRVVGQAESGEAALDLIRAGEPEVDIVLMDANLGEPALAATRAIVEAAPPGRAPARVLMMCPSPDGRAVVDALLAGAQGCISKKFDAEQLEHVM